MEDVEDLPLETIYNLIKNNVLSLDDFQEWFINEQSKQFDNGRNREFIDYTGLLDFYD
jgi:hypothetical protein